MWKANSLRPCTLPPSVHTMWTCVSTLAFGALPGQGAGLGAQGRHLDVHGAEKGPQATSYFRRAAWTRVARRFRSPAPVSPSPGRLMAAKSDWHRPRAFPSCSMATSISLPVAQPLAFRCIRRNDCLPGRRKVTHGLVAGFLHHPGTGNERGGGGLAIVPLKPRGSGIDGIEGIAEPKQRVSKGRSPGVERRLGRTTVPWAAEVGPTEAAERRRGKPAHDSIPTSM